MEDVVKKILDARVATKATLKGIELMQWNLFWKLRPWIMREDGKRYVNVGEVVDKVKKYAPKAILKSRAEFIKAVESLWATTHEYSIDNDEFLKEDLEDALSYIFDVTK